MVYAHILKPYILDLVPGNSCVEHLLAEGYDVYLLDWGVPDPEDQGLLGLWTLFSRCSERLFDPDLLVETFGNIPEALIERLAGAETCTAKPIADRYAA